MSTGALIVTLALDDRSRSRFDDLRRRHFPPGRNHLAAHVTLFHALPAHERDAVDGDLAAAAAATGLELSRYLGGPWEPLSVHPFAGGVPVTA